MKRSFVCVIVAVILSVCIPFVAFADLGYFQVVPKIKELSDADLLSLLEYVEDEIDGRESITKKAYVNPGRYIVGIDIPVGTYCIKCSDSWGSFTLKIKSSSSEWPIYSEWGLHNLDNIKLEKGQIVEISGDAVYFSEYKGLDFWD